MNELTAERSAELFESGLYCAESVLQAIAEAQDVKCDLIPRIATGFCSGVARTCGMCGAVSGAILAIGMSMGRSSADESVEPVYRAVRFVLDGFESEFGTLNCESLLGCDLGTDEGQRAFQERKLCEVCSTYVAKSYVLDVGGSGTSCESILGRSCVNSRCRSG